MLRADPIAWVIIAALLAGCPEPEPVKASGPDAQQAPEALSQAVAQLIAMEGEVVLQRSGLSAPAALGALQEGDALETGAGAKATVSFSSGRTVEIGPDARFSISKGEEGVVLEVARGLVLSRVPAEAAADSEARVQLSILTPFGLTRIGQGNSEVSVQVDKEAAQVEVLLGKVEFITRNGQASGLAAGERISATGEGATVSQVGVELLPVTLLPSGRVVAKKKGGKGWAPVSKKGQRVGEGEAVKVKDGRLKLQLEGTPSHLTLGKGAQLVFEKGSRSRSGDLAKVALLNGELTASLEPGKRTRVELGELALASDQGGQFTILKTAQGYQLAASAGDLLVQDGAGQLPIRAGQVALLSPGKPASIRDVEREEVAVPSRMGMRVYHSGLGRVAIAWEGGPGDYQVEVASDSKFRERLLFGLVHQASVNVRAPARGALYWRVRTAQGDREVDKGSAHFAPEPAPKELSRLRNEVVDGAEKTTIYYQDKPPAVTFTYAPEKGAASYRVQVYRDGDLSKTVAERVVKEERLPLEAGALLEGAYLWSVTPLSAQGDELRGGKMNRLLLTYDNAVQMLIIQQPRNGAVVSARTVEVAGIAPVGSRVWVNGRPVSLDEKARFETSTQPVGRPPRVIFRLQPAQGPEVLTVRTLRKGR